MNYGLSYANKEVYLRTDAHNAGVSHEAKLKALQHVRAAQAATASARTSFAQAKRTAGVS